MDQSLLSPRSTKAHAMHMAGLNARVRTPNMPFNTTTQAYPPFAEGALLPPAPGLRRLQPIIPLGTGVVLQSHPIAKELSELLKGFKTLDHNNHGHLFPNDILRGLSVFSLSSDDKKAQDKLNKYLISHMKDNGAVNYNGFVKSLADDAYITQAVKDVLAQQWAEKQAAAAAAAAQKEGLASGPKLRPGVTADELRAAQSIIKDKFFDKYSGFQAAFRSVDRDGSGYINRAELEQCLVSLNLNTIRKEVIDTLIDFIDCENDLEDDTDGGPTDIGYQEFARAFATNDIMTMRPLVTLKKAMPPPTPPPVNVVPSNVAAVINTKFKPDKVEKAFKFIDSDGLGSLSRNEMRRAMSLWGLVLTDDELTQLFDACDKNKDGAIDYKEFLDMVTKSPSLTEVRALQVKPALRPGVRAEDLRRAQQLAKEKYLTYYKRLDSAFKNIDKDRSGSITREELLIDFEEMNILGMMQEKVANNLIDFMDLDDGGEKIEFKEFARVISAEDVMTMAPVKTEAKRQARSGIGRQKMNDMPGAQGISWTNTAA